MTHNDEVFFTTKAARVQRYHIESMQYKIENKNTRNELEFKTEKKVRNITQGAVKLTPAVDAYSSNEAIENTTTV